jgi:sec-independent protein translocase protein TatA
MIGDLFDSPWKILIIAIVILVLFGSRKLPDAARSLGKSMRILKTEISDMHEEHDDSQSATTYSATVQPPAPPTPQITHQEQVDQLQAQLDQLRNQNAGSDTAQTTHQAS